MRVLVCGSRHFKDYMFLKEVLDNFHDKNNITEIIHGAAKGADLMAAEWAMSRSTSMGAAMGIRAFPADWNKHGKAAGPIRNKQMLDEGKPDKVIAFLAPNSRGTQNMIDQATKAGKPVQVVLI